MVHTLNEFKASLMKGTWNWSLLAEQLANYFFFQMVTCYFGQEKQMRSKKLKWEILLFLSLLDGFFFHSYN